MFTITKYKVNAAYNTLPVLKDVFTKCHTKFPLLETSGSNDMAVLNQVSYMTLSREYFMSVQCQKGKYFPGKEW